MIQAMTITTIGRATALGVASLAIVDAMGAASAVETAGPDTVVEAEYAFADSAKPLGVRGAFLKYLATDSIICSPAPVNGVVSTAAGKANADTLEWYPILAHTASSADLGYTTGPWTYRTADGKTEVNGTFLSVWRKQPDGAWRVVVDCGVDHPKPAMAPKGLPRVATPAISTATAHVAPSWIDPVANADAQYTAAATRSATAALTEFGAAEVRVLAKGAAPAIGVKAGQAILDAHAQTFGTTWRHVFASESGDGTLGYAWGYIGDPKSPRPAAAYVNVWQRERAGAPWKIVAQALQVLPQK